MGSSAAVARLLPRAPDAHVAGSAVAHRDRLRHDLLLHQADRESGEVDDLPARHQGHLGHAQHAPRRRRSTSPASARSTRAGSSTTAAGEARRAGRAVPDTDTALREHEDIFKQYFGTIIPQNDDEFAALEQRGLVRGSFIYVPAGVRIELPLQPLPHQRGEHGPVRAHADHRRRGRRCTTSKAAPRRPSSDSLTAPSSRSSSRRAAAAATQRSRSWSIERLQPRHQARGRARRNATMEWVDGEPRLEADDEVPGDLLRARRARRGAVDRVRRQGPASGRGRQVRASSRGHTSSVITSKSISRTEAGRLSRPARGGEGASASKSKVVCDALILDDESRSDTYPYIRIDENDVDIGHEATVSKIGEEQLFYLMSRGLSEAEAARWSSAASSSRSRRSCRSSTRSR